MLVRKRNIKPSDPQIQLPDSMFKVLPSDHSNKIEGAMLNITKNSIQPAPGGTGLNSYLGRRFDKSLPPPPEISFLEAIKKKKLKPMISRLWRTMGVPERICQDYLEGSPFIYRAFRPWFLTSAGYPRVCLS